MRLERIDAAEVLGGVCTRFARRAEENGLLLERSAEPGLEVRADRLRLEQAVGNLLDNALRYGAGPIGLTAVGRNGSVELHVDDRGPGFPEEFRSRAFERFSRADPSRGNGGSGLGLAIVETIASAHGGEAHVTNREGGGADAWLVLPAVQE